MPIARCMQSNLPLTQFTLSALSHHFSLCLLLSSLSLAFLLSLLSPSSFLSSPSPSPPSPPCSEERREDQGDGHINKAVLPGNQAHCRRLLCRMLKRYLFVHRCPLSSLPPSILPSLHYRPLPQSSSRSTVWISLHPVCTL